MIAVSLAVAVVAACGSGGAPGATPSVARSAAPAAGTANPGTPIPSGSASPYYGY